MKHSEAWREIQYLEFCNFIICYYFRRLIHFKINWMFYQKDMMKYIIFKRVVTDDKLNVIHQSTKFFFEISQHGKKAIRLCQDVIFERELFLFADSVLQACDGWWWDNFIQAWSVVTKELSTHRPGPVNYPDFLLKILICSRNFLSVLEFLARVILEFRFVHCCIQKPGDW